MFDNTAEHPLPEDCMAYVCELSPNQTIYLENSGSHTIVTQLSHSPGQQQQSTTRFETGAWTAPPQVSRTANGVCLRLATERGEQFIQAQGSSLNLTSTAAGGDRFQPLSQTHPPSQPPMQPLQPLKMQPMEEMPPMQPMEMGDMKMAGMEMTQSPMSMRMGKMSMSMGNSTETAEPPHERRFCSQCGAPVQPGDRFCASCGHRLA